MVPRPLHLETIQQALKRSRIVALVGPRQAGKTTLAREIVPPGTANYFDLEDPISLARLAEPMTSLAPLRGTVVIDEVQRRPELFPILRVLADRRPLPARFLILGSASPELLHQSSESLAGRIEILTLSGFNLAEVGASNLDRHWFRGGFPEAFLARTEADSAVWRNQFLSTFLERDLPSFGYNLPAETLRRFWTMVAHYHGGVWNAAEPARSLGVSQPTVRRYLDLFTSFFLVHQLQPWHENLAKRQVKAPKVYFRDSGLLHSLLGIPSRDALLSHPKLGASFEGYAIEELLAAARPDSAYFWATHTGAELDLLLFRHGKRYGVEIKRQDAPRLTASMRGSLDELKLESLTVIYPGDQSYPLAETIQVIPLPRLIDGSEDPWKILAPTKVRRRSARTT
jgi:uncharacterized protein